MVPHGIFAGSRGCGRWSLGLLMLLVVLASTGCPPSLAGDWGHDLEGVASGRGWVGYEVNGELFRVDVEIGDTPEQIGPRLTELMKAAGLVVDCERFFVDCQKYQDYDGPCYTFILRDLDEPSDGEAHALGIAVGHAGPIRDYPEHLDTFARGFFDILNANDITAMRRATTVEFFHEQVSDMMASMVATGEQVIVESTEDPTIGCYEATISLHLVWVAGTEEQQVDGYLTWSRYHFTDWLVSDWDIR